MAHTFGHIDDSTIGSATALQTSDDLEFMTVNTNLNQRQEDIKSSKIAAAGKKAENAAKQAAAKAQAAADRSLSQAKAGVANLNSVRLFNLGL